MKQELEDRIVEANRKNRPVLQRDVPLHDRQGPNSPRTVA